MKRILALDGGGIRGVFTLQILARIEALLRAESGRPGLVLADAFDLIAGTSTGAIIAAYLSWGEPVETIRRLYAERGPDMFCKVPWHRRWRYKYCADRLARMFQEQFREDDEVGAPALFGSRRLRTLLLVVMRNASTGSPWPITNHPGAMFNTPGRADCNLNIPLWQVVRASSAAPTFFPPEQIRVGRDRFLFVDGGITPFNNPALIAVLMATLPQYGIGWPSGRDALHVVSVGTGRFRAKLPDKIAEQIHLVDQLTFVIPALLGSVAAEQDLLCRVMGDCVYGEPLDSELGALDEPTLLGPEEQKFTYVRYNQRLDSLPARLADAPPMRADLDNLDLMPELTRLGRAYAEQNVRLEHLYPRGARADAGHAERAGAAPLGRA